MLIRISPWDKICKMNESQCTCKKKAWAGEIVQGITQGHPSLATGMPSGKPEKERAPWAWKDPSERAALGNLISHLRSRAPVGLGDETECRAVKGGHRRGESHCKHMLHVLREGQRAGMDHCIIRESNSYTHCPGGEDSCLHLSEFT